MLENPARLCETDEARAGLRKHAEAYDKLDDVNAKRKARDTEIGIAQLGGFPADL